MLKNQNQPSELEDRIGFIKQFMNGATPHPASREVLQGVVQNVKLLQKEAWGEEVARKRKQGSICSGHLFKKNNFNSSVVNMVLYSFQVHNIVIQQFYPLLSAHQDK